jgi:hypothetical protein
MAPQTVIIPEVIEPDEKLPRDLVALRRFAFLLDEAVAIPGTTRRIGLDGAIGLIPGVGDVIGALLSTWIIIGALRHRVPLMKVARMVVNVLIDMVIGDVPVIGDIFDFLFEENVMNLKLLLRYRDRSRPPRSFKSIALGAFLIICFILAVGLILLVLTIVAVFWLIQHR